MTELGAVRRRDAGQAVCDAIRNDVVTRVFTPGDRLTEERLAARYRVSRIPVREALRTLEAEGFVHSRPYGGTFVAELSDKEAEDLLGIRLLIEPFGAERAATRRTAVHLATLELLVAEAREILDAGSSTGLADLNTRFHRVLAEASGSPTLAALVAQLGYKISWVYSVELPGVHRTRGPSTRRSSRRCATRIRRRRVTGSPTTSCAPRPPTDCAEDADR